MTPAKDRFEKIVAKYSQTCKMNGFGMRDDEVVRLLKREHAAIVRAVKRLRAYADQFGPGYDRACEDVLALLATRKGKG